VARVRIVAAQVTLSVVLDDGETLTPIQVDPITLSGAQWAALDPAAIVADLQAQVDAQPPTA